MKGALGMLGLIWLCGLGIAQTTLKTYQTPGLHPERISGVYSIAAGTQKLLVYRTAPPAKTCPEFNCDGGDYARAAGRSMSWTTFSFSGQVELAVSKSLEQGPVRDIQVRPSRGLGKDYQIVSKELDRGSVRLRILRPGVKLSVEFMDDGWDGRREIPQHGLMIFADGLEGGDLVKPPSATQRNVYLVKYGQAFDPEKAGRAGVVYFEPGVHELGYWEVPASVQWVYLAGGAYVRGAINSATEIKAGQRGFKITGRGILSGETLPWLADKRSRGKLACRDDCWFNAVKLLQLGTDGFVLEGITLINSPHWMVTGFKDDNITWNPQTGDEETGLIDRPDNESAFTGTMKGFKILGNWRWNGDGVAVLPGTAVSDCFINAYDDAFKLYNSRGRVSNCVVWQMDNGAVFQMGWYSKTVFGTQVSDIAIIHAEWTGTNYNWGVINYADRGWNGGRGAIMGFKFSDIVLEGPSARIIALEVENVTNQNIQFMNISNLSVGRLFSDEEIAALAAEGNGAKVGAVSNWEDSPIKRPINVLNARPNRGTITSLVIENLTIGGQKVTPENYQTLGRFVVIGSPKFEIR